MEGISILFSVHDYDKDGDVSEKGVFLHFGGTRVKVALDMDEFRALPSRIQSMVDEVEQTYQDFAQS